MRNLSKPCGIICDMDGTLVDSEGFAKNMWQKAAAVLGYEIPDELYLSMIGSSVASSNQRFLEYFGMNFPVDDLRNKKMEIESSSYGKGLVKEKNGALEFVSAIRKYQIPLGLGTSTEKSRAVKRLAEAGLSESFDFCVFGDQVSKHKPDPETYLEVARVLGVEIKCCLIVEDSPSGVMAALASGAQVAWIKDHVEISDDLKLQVLEYESLSALNKDLATFF